ncbi:uncharacterized protein LOC141807425 [Halichoeres trimaculatus]|uniref:uncharacterized protein LOC141807425 n=1 Tax=Halichoeres trimaculatus TaxID=147232 RepID=UPI003D9E20A2
MQQEKGETSSFFSDEEEAGSSKPTPANPTPSTSRRSNISDNLLRRKRRRLRNPLFKSEASEDSPHTLVQAKVLVFYKPPADPDPTSVLTVLMLPSKVSIPDVLNYRKKLDVNEHYIEMSPYCKLQPQQEYTLSTCPADDSVLVQPTTAEFDSDNYDKYFPSFQVALEKNVTHLKLFLRDTNNFHSVWEGRVCLSSSEVQRSCGQSALNQPPNLRLLWIRRWFINEVSEPVLKSLLDKLLEKMVMTDSEVKSADQIKYREDKARFVIDRVRRKGEAASSEMIEALWELDPVLLCDVAWQERHQKPLTSDVERSFPRPHIDDLPSSKSIPLPSLKRATSLPSVKVIKQNISEQCMFELSPPKSGIISGEADVLHAQKNSYYALLGSSGAQYTSTAGYNYSSSSDKRRRLMQVLIQCKQRELWAAKHRLPAYTHVTSFSSCDSDFSSNSKPSDSIPGPQDQSSDPQNSSTVTEGSRAQAERSSVHSEAESGGDIDAEVELEAAVTAVSCSVTNTPTIQTCSSDPSQAEGVSEAWPLYSFFSSSDSSLSSSSDSTGPVLYRDDELSSESSFDVNFSSNFKLCDSVPGPQDHSPDPQNSSTVTEGSRAQAERSSVHFEAESGGDVDAEVELEAAVTAVSCSVTNTLPPHAQTCSSGPSWTEGLSGSLPRSHSCPSLSHMTSAENQTLTRAQSLPDLQLNSSCEQFTPDITADEDHETYRFQCSSPGLYQCSVTGLVFHMEGEGDLVYRTVPWNRKLLSQHHKQPAGPLFDIKCEQQSVCQLHLPHCEIRSTGGADFLSVAHFDEEGMEFIVPHKITETHVIINITGFSAFGNVKDEDSPSDPVRALVLVFYKPPADPDPSSLLNVMLLPRNVAFRDVLRYRKKLDVNEIYVEMSPHCKLQPQQDYTLSTCPEDDSVLVEPTTAEFDSDNYDNYFPSFQVTLVKTMTHLRLFLRDTNNSHTVWERQVCLSSSEVQRSCGQSALNLPPNQRLFDIRNSFITGVSGPVLKSLIDTLLQRTVMTDSERESVDVIRNRGDKARFVVDTVRGKGEAASSEMIEALCDLDPFFSEHLGLM